jgi:hypothetical protein
MDCSIRPDDSMLDGIVLAIFYAGIDGINDILSVLGVDTIKKGFVG